MSSSCRRSNRRRWNSIASTRATLRRMVGSAVDAQWKLRSAGDAGFSHSARGRDMIHRPMVVTDREGKLSHHWGMTRGPGPAD